MGKRKYSKDRKVAQKVERALTRAMKHATEAQIEGSRTFERASRKSAKKRRDGAIKDAIANSVRAGLSSARYSGVIAVDLFNAAKPFLPTRKELAKALFPKK